MDLNATKLFVAVVSTGSLSAASKKTGIPISTLSRKMNELEQDLSVQLLDRSKQGVKPTYQGQQFYEQARCGIELLQDAREAVTSAHKLEGKLRLSVPPNFSLWWDLLLEFQQRYPDIKIFCHSSERVVDLFDDGIDVALRMGNINTDDVIAKPILTVDAMFVASPKLLAHFGTPASLTEIAKFPIAAWEGLNYRPFEWISGGEKVKYEPLFSSNNAQALIHYALNDMCVSYVLDFSVKPWLDRGELIQLLPDTVKQSLPLFLVYPRRKYPSTLVRAYLDFCNEWVGRLKQP